MNPILPQKYYIPDVEARQYEDGTICLYGSCDAPGNDVYCNRLYHVFSSKTVGNWEAHENSFHVRDAHEEKFLLYAPDCEYINGKYCLFYCMDSGEEGVAFSDSPYGPFKDSRPIINADKTMIDPSIFIDDDGSVYYYWAQIHARAGKLDTDTWTVLESTINNNILSEEEHGFHEGSSVRKRNGIYYYVYADISRGKPTSLGYATSDSPLGPFVKRGIIIDNAGIDPGNWNNHGCIQELNGQWYVFYHRATHNSEFSRQVCMEPITFNEDGTINEVEMTTQGIDGPLDCYKPLDAFRACMRSGQAYVDDFNDGKECFEFYTNVHNGDEFGYKYLNFSEAPKSFALWASSVFEGFEVSVYLDQDEAKEVARVTVPITGGKFNFAKVEAECKMKIEGVHSVHLKVYGCDGNIGNLKTLCFE